METKYGISTEMELSETVYDLSTLIDISTHSDNIYGNSTTENNTTHNYDTIVDVNNVHENNMHENVHDDHSSMSAQTHTCHQLLTEICEILQIFRGDLMKFCEIFLKITFSLT